MINQIQPDKSIREIIKGNEDNEIFHFQYNLINNKIIRPFNQETKTNVLQLEKFYFSDKYKAPEFDTSPIKLANLTRLISLNERRCKNNR